MMHINERFYLSNDLDLDSDWQRARKDGRDCVILPDYLVCMYVTARCRVRALILILRVYLCKCMAILS